MKAKELNLCELLKGHEGETFYSPLTQRNITLKKVNKMLVFEEHLISLDDKGAFYPNGECMVFPSKDQRDWNKWAEEQNPKVPKTYRQFIELDRDKEYAICQGSGFLIFTDEGECTIEKSALALLKIHQLIEAGYGGNVNNSDINNQTAGINPYLNIEIKEGYNKDFRTLKPLLFRNTKLAKEFLSYSENVHLIKDFYMI